MQNFDVIVVGSGISGLSLAHDLASDGYKVLIIEKKKREGGAFASFFFASGFGEMGAHTVYNSYGDFIALLERLNLTAYIEKKPNYPFKFLNGSEISSPFSFIDWFDLLKSLPKLFTEKREGQTVKEYYQKVLGKKNFSSLFSFAFNAVLSQKADDFPAHLLFQKRPRRKDIYRKFFIRGAFEKVVKEILVHPNITLIHDEVTSMYEQNGEVHLATKSGAHYLSKRAAIATSPRVAAELLHETERRLSELLRQINSVKVESMTVIALKKDLTLPLVAGLIPTSKTNFFSVVSADPFIKNQSQERAFTFHFEGEKLSTEEKVNEIEKVLNLSKDHWLQIIERHFELPQLTKHHEDLITEVKQLVNGSHYFLVGSYFNGLAIEECVKRSMSEAIRLKLSLGTPAHHS